MSVNETTEGQKKASKQEIQEDNKDASQPARIVWPAGHSAQRAYLSKARANCGGLPGTNLGVGPDKGLSENSRLAVARCPAVRTRAGPQGGAAQASEGRGGPVAAGRI